MSEIEIITDGGRRRHWPASEKLRFAEETLSGMLRAIHVALPAILVLHTIGVIISSRIMAVALPLLIHWT